MRRLSWPCSQSVHLVSHCQRRRGYGDDVSCGRRWIGSEVVRGPVLPRACRTMCAFLGEVGWSVVHVRACTLSVPRVGLPGTHLTNPPRMDLGAINCQSFI